MSGWVVCVNPVLVGVSGCVHSGFGEQAPERRGGRKFHRRVPVEGAAYEVCPRVVCVVCLRASPLGRSFGALASRAICGTN